MKILITPNGNIFEDSKETVKAALELALLARKVYKKKRWKIQERRGGFVATRGKASIQIQVTA